MQVFKAYFKVMRAYAGGISIYLVILVGIAAIFSLMAPSSATTEFAETRTPVAVINRDGEAPLAKGLADYVGDIFTVKPYADDPEKLQDALFYRNVEYVMIIPRGFSEAFMVAGSSQTGEVNDAMAIQKVVVPASASGHYVDMRIDKFLNTASIHRDLGAARAEASRAEESMRERQARLVAAVRADLSAETPVTLRAAGTTVEDPSYGPGQGYEFYFAYLAYALLSMAMMGISSVMIAFNRTDVRLRNLCASMPKSAFNIAVAAGHGTFALGCWAIVMLCGILLYGNSLFASGRAWLYFANSFVLTVVATSIGFLVGNFIKTSSAQAGIVVAAGLSMSFLSGTFVPQAVMSPSVLAIARFLPTYWYIRANDTIGTLVGSVSGSIYPVLGYMLIQLGFAVAIFSVALLVGKEHRLAEL